MAHPLLVWCAVPAFAINLVLAAWCVFRGARSVPTLLMALLLACLAAWNGFEFLWIQHGVRPYELLSFLPVAIAPALAFHYSVALEPPSIRRRGVLTVVYCGSTLFALTTVVAYFDESAYVFFKSPPSNAMFLAFLAPTAAWTLYVLDLRRRHARESAVRSLFTYPLVAGLIVFPFGIVELGRQFNERLPKLGSLGALIGGAILATGVIRHRTVYDAFALLRKDAGRVLRAAVQGILIVDANGTIAFANSVARSILGPDPKSLGEAGLEIPAAERAVTRRPDGRVLEIRKVPSTEYPLAGRMSLVLQDRTRDFVMMESLASSESLGVLGTAAATLAHEIRTPLAAIRAVEECLVHDAKEGRPSEPRHLELLAQETRRLETLLERGLQLGRPLEMKPEPCDVNELLREAVRRTPANGSRIEERLAPNLPNCLGDPDLLSRLFGNLLRNAVEAAGEVRVTTAREGERLSVAVFSAGARMPDEVVEKLFEPFVTTKERGTGLGLAFCRKIAMAHGADIDGRNVDGGVEFRVRLPA